MLSPTPSARSQRSRLCSKVDVRLHAVPAPAAAALLARQSEEAAEADAETAGSGGGPDPAFSWLSPGQAFQVKTQCMSLEGSDLPRLLPPSAAAPVPLALPGWGEKP